MKKAANVLQDPHRAQDAAWSSPELRSCLAGLRAGLWCHRGHSPPLASLDWGNGFPPSSLARLHPTLCPDHRPTIHLHFHLVLVLGGGGRKGFGEKLRAGTGGGKPNTFASFLGSPSSVHFPTACLHRPWATGSSWNLLLVAAWTWGFWAEEGLASRSAFPRTNTMPELALLEPRDQLSTSVCVHVCICTCVCVYVVDRCQEPICNPRGSTSEYFRLPPQAILSTDLEVALNL